MTRERNYLPMIKRKLYFVSGTLIISNYDIRRDYLGEVIVCRVLCNTTKHSIDITVDKSKAGTFLYNKFHVRMIFKDNSIFVLFSLEFFQPLYCKFHVYRMITIIVGVHGCCISLFINLFTGFTSDIVPLPIYISRPE